MEASCAVLGMDTFDEDVFFDKVETIRVEGQHELLFTMKDGPEVRQHREHTAQKESWTPERRALHAANRTKNPAKVPGVSYMTGKVRCELCILSSLQVEIVDIFERHLGNPGCFSFVWGG